jgi:membrane protein implicated in regulation of membrane protease activity
MGYKKARATGRNPYLWAAICGGTFVGVQLVVGFGFGAIIGLGTVLLGWSETLFDDLSWPITIVSIVVSLLSVFLIFRFLDHVPEEMPSMPPPPPPRFDQEDQQ